MIFKKIVISFSLMISSIFTNDALAVDDVEMVTNLFNSEVNILDDQTAIMMFTDPSYKLGRYQYTIIFLPLDSEISKKFFNDVLGIGVLQVRHILDTYKNRGTGNQFLVASSEEEVIVNLFDSFTPIYSYLTKKTIESYPGVILIQIIKNNS